MAASALIKFTQGLVVGADGEAQLGVAGTSVSLTNVDNTDVGSWQFDLAYADPRGSLVATTDWAHGDGSSPAATFEPDTNGSFRWVLKVWAAPGRVGDPASVDIRVFNVPEPNGMIVPPAQLWPLPLPDPQSGDAKAKPNEMNFGGQVNGWAGLGSGDGLLNDVVQRVDAMSAWVQIPAPGQGPVPVPFTAIGLETPTAIFSYQNRMWAVCPGDASKGKPSSLVRLTPFSFLPDAVVYCTNLDDVWLNAVAVTGTVLDNCTLCVLMDKVSDGTRYFALMRIDTSLGNPLLEYLTVPAGLTPTPDPVLHPSNGYFRNRIRPPAPLEQILNMVVTVTTTGAAYRELEYMSGGDLLPDQSEVTSIRPIGFAYDPDGTKYPDELPHWFILSEGWSSTLGYVWQLDSREAQFLTLDQHHTYAATGQYSQFQLLFGGVSLYVLAFGVSAGNVLTRVNPVTLAVVAEASSATLEVQNGLHVQYDAVRSLLLAVLATTDAYTATTAVTLNPTTLAVVGARTLTYSSVEKLSCLYPAVDPLSNGWMIPLYDSYRTSNRDPALLAVTSYALDFLYYQQNRGVQFAPELPHAHDVYHLHVAQIPWQDAGLQDGTPDRPYTSIQQALNAVARGIFKNSRSIWKISVGPGEYPENLMLTWPYDGYTHEAHVIIEGSGIYGSVLSGGSFEVRTPNDYSDWLEIDFVRIAAQNMNVLFTQGTGGTPSYTLLLEDTNTAAISFVTSGAWIDVELLGSWLMDPDTSWSTTSAPAISTTETNSIVRLDGALVYYGIEANRIVAKDSLVGGTLTADEVFFDHAGLFGGGLIAATRVHIDSTALQYMIEFPTAFSSSTEIVPVGTLSYAVPNVAHTGDLGATLIDTIDTDGWPASTAFTVKAKTLVYSPSSDRDTYFEAVGLYKRQSGQLNFRGDEVLVSVNGQGASLSSTCRLNFSASSDRYVSIVCAANEGTTDLFWRATLEFSFVRGVV